MGRAGLTVACVLLATACSGEVQSTTSTAASTAATTATTALTASHRLDYTDGPTVWFGPLPPLTDPSLPFANGSSDYYDLFAPDASWSEAEGRVDVFGVPSTWVRHYSTDEQIRAVIGGLASRGIALSLEVGPLPGAETAEGCIGAESYGGVYELDMMRRIIDLGGTVDVIAFDEPYAFGHKADGPTDCQRSLEEVAAEAADFTRMAREINPNVIVGDIEPMWVQPEIGADDMAAWLDAYEAAAGEPLAFLHIDMDWTRLDWAQVARQVEGVADERDVPFGVIYFGGPGGTSDQTWIELAAQHAYQFEEVAGGTPDDIPFASWEDYPEHTLPESDPYTFTGLIDRYFAPRTALAVVPQPAPAGVLSMKGTLQTVVGELVVGADLMVDATPRDGQQQRQTVSGRVADGSASAVVIVRVNAENAGPGTADIRLYQVAYTEDGGANAVPEPAFSDGGWTPYGAGAGTFPTSDHGGGRMLQLTAKPDQDLFVDSQVFPVTAGTTFEFTITDSVPEDSVGAGYIAIAFLDSDGLELSRTIIPFAPAPQSLGTGTTDASGAIVADVDGLEAGRYAVQVAYPGDLTHWPSRVDFETTLG